MIYKFPYFQGAIRDFPDFPGVIRDFHDFPGVIRNFPGVIRDFHDFPAVSPTMNNRKAEIAKLYALLKTTPNRRERQD